MRQNPKVLSLPFKENIGRADRDNAIDLYIGEDYMDVLADGEWERVFTENLKYLQYRKRENGLIRIQK